MQDLPLMKEIYDVKIDDSYEPSSDVTEEEKIIGELNDSEKKMYIFYSTSIKDLKDMLLSGNPIEPGKACRLGRLGDAIRDMFWVFLEHRLNLLEGYDGAAIGLRKGWKVVIVPENESKESLDDDTREFLVMPALISLFKC
jgi:hypothetical protein